MLHTLDPLTLPLNGLQLIEASAGTGKTFTLAALYVRLVLGHGAGSGPLGPGLFPPQILVMTFTDAATAELRERIRERLAQAARFFQTGDRGAADDFLLALQGQVDPGQWPLCAWRLDMAAQWMDDAAIFTIHGWSSRMLKTHAFDSASLFTQNRVEDAERLQLMATRDYWRRWFYALDAHALGALKVLGDTPQALLVRLQARWKASERAPQSDVPAPEPPDRLLERWSVWQQQRMPLESLARQGWRDDVIQALQAAAAAKTLKGYRSDWLGGWLAKMAAWAQGEEIEPEVLARFSRATLLAKGWLDAARWPVLADIEALHTHGLGEPEVADTLLAHAAQAVLRDYQRAKAQAAQFDFSDLLQNLYHALQAPDGRLAAAIAAQYPVALVDEFQDTDPWQFGALRRIYSCKPNQDVRCSPIFHETVTYQGEAGTVPASLGLIMIGDPKQAIYSFRGADLATYLQAREQAQGIYTLPGNYRSTPAVVTAVSRMFAQADAPFGSVPFVAVKACNHQVRPLQVAGQTQVALTVWHVPFEKTPTKDDFLQALSAVFASQMVTLLQSAAARPGDMAVLVRDRHEATAIRAALSARSVRSVYLSERNSVYASQQAHDLWRILRAVAQPGASRLVRAALATPTWALSWSALDALLADEAGWDAQVEQFMQWQQVWQAQGFLPMLYRLLHDQGLAARLLQRSTQGERELTNLLHLGELLQAASLALQGEGALIRYLEAQLRHPQASGDAAQLRLESDAQLVQVVTVHKSKGLEYPLVFLPFVSLYRAAEKDADRPDAERLAEDIRLLYVALTRARQALWLGVAQVRGDVDGPNPQPKSAVSRLLGRRVPGDLWERLQTWVCADVQVQAAPRPSGASYQPVQGHAPTPQPALQPQRRLTQRWWSASFSALTRGLMPHGMADLPTERDEKMGDAQLDATTPDELPLALMGGGPGAPGSDLLAIEPAFNSFPAGSRYGTLLHDLLEWQAAQGWLAASAPADPALTQAWDASLARLGQRLNLEPQHGALLDPWIRAILLSNMPLAHKDKVSDAIQLGSIPTEHCWPEMAFTLPVQRLASQRLDQLIGQHLWPGQPRAALPRQALEGMLTGFMDLVFVHQGRYYVLDYKSNRLPDYSGVQLQQAMLAHRYDVQAALYVLALHRLLRSRLGPSYDYERHMGGALYLFLRGIDQPGGGLLPLQPPRALIEALDQAFGATARLEVA
ncbi:MAG: exodeoxyribonuclease V subunit beta [Rhodoferax sp.]|uniref:exodeoxyribonuclease V subunit beta n=1 Tax=Rhodoferax sp. TaxID=50421 RepID=UPI001B3EA3C0|nr:exodeoxyribonuclease V subunit beta [Rhodoferax sp.]MBP9904366.1 exodeoxyribonuclease V subunit beta [Rhodoferax sp.]